MNKLLEQAIKEVSALPEEQQEELAARLLDEVRQRAPRKGKWAKVADRLAELDILKGRSAAFERHTREFRDGFGFRGRPNA
jgi:hypothetical protein